MEENKAINIPINGVIHSIPILDEEMTRISNDIITTKTDIQKFNRDLARSIENLKIFNNQLIAKYIYINGGTFPDTPKYDTNPKKE